MKCAPTNVKFIYVYPALDTRRKPELKKWNREVRTKCALYLIDKTNVHFEEGKWQLYLTLPELHLIILQKIRWVVSDLSGSCLE